MSYDIEDAPTELWFEHRLKRGGTCWHCRCSRELHAHGCPEAPEEQRQGDEE